MDGRGVSVTHSHTPFSVGKKASIESSIKSLLKSRKSRAELSSFKCLAEKPMYARNARVSSQKVRLASRLKTRVTHWVRALGPDSRNANEFVTQVFRKNGGKAAVGRSLMECTIPK